MRRARVRVLKNAANSDVRELWADWEYMRTMLHVDLIVSQLATDPRHH